MTQRYGAPRPWRRTAGIATAVALALVGGLFLAWAAWSYATPAAQSELVGFTVTDQHEVVADVQVELAAEASDVQCVLRALAEEAQLMLDEEVVAEPHDLDLCMILGAGWPFWLGGITPYLDRAGHAEQVNGKRFLPRGVASVPTA